MRSPVFIQTNFAWQLQSRLNARSTCRVDANGCGLDLCIAKLDLPFLLVQDEHEGLGGSLGNDADLERVWLGHHLAAHQAVLVRCKIEGLRLSGQARDGGADFGCIVWKRLIFAEQPDPQAWFASVLGQQRL